MDKFIMVGLGGALGAMGRYGISLIPVKTDFPILTLLTNLAGALLIGFIAGILTGKDGYEKTVTFLKTGVCGGFTTFSTFSLEAWQLLEKGKLLHGTAYIVLSVILCICGVVAGQYAARILRSA